MQQQLHILAVDDEPSKLALYRDALYMQEDSARGFNLTLCRRSDEAIKTVRKAIDQNEPFAVVFLNLKLAYGANGVKTGQEIRRLDPYVNFVIMQGRLDADPQDATLSIPPVDKILYAQKPFDLREIRQFASALGTKWHSEMMLRNANLELEKKIKELEKSQKALLDYKFELENVNNQLMETNNALSVLARNIERTRKESEKRVIQRTSTLILPILEKLREDRALERYKNDLDLLVGDIQNLPADLRIDNRITDYLSATELRIASMIRIGMSSKEIAGHLCISLSTVKTHRRNIREKLKLKKSGINLRAYLEAETYPE
ncbi:LuxR C-terminal-related transcriptional regulator [Thermodesulfobacteriota bacterium]